MIKRLQEVVQRAITAEQTDGREEAALLTSDGALTVKGRSSPDRPFDPVDGAAQGEGGTGRSASDTAADRKFPGAGAAGRSAVASAAEAGSPRPPLATDGEDVPCGNSQPSPWAVAVDGISMPGETRGDGTRMEAWSWI